MVKLSVYRPADVADEPRILPFNTTASRENVRRRIDPPHRAASQGRLLLHNRVCPECSRITVEPVELLDGHLDRKGALIPGSATVVGFHCNACGHEWPAAE